MPLINNTKIDIGVNTFQHKCINWSILNRGNVQRTQTCTSNKLIDFEIIQNAPHIVAEIVPGVPLVHSAK